MPMRFGEMVLVIRTQDYASRNLNRLSQNLGKLSTQQRLQRQLATQQLRQARTISRMDTIKQDIGLMQRRVVLEQALADATMRRRAEAKRLYNLKRRVDPTVSFGAFGGPAPPRVAATRDVLRLKAAEGALKGELKSVMDELARTNPALAKLGSSAAAARVGRLTRELALLDRQLRIVQSDIAITQNAIGHLRWENIHRGGQALSRFGRIAQLVGLVTTGAFVAMGNQAANFSANATLAATQARNLGGDTADALSKSKVIQAAVLDQMQKYPVAAQDMTNATYEIFSSLDLMNNKGIVNTTKGLHILELANKAAVAGGVSLDQSMQGIIITLNNFDPALRNPVKTLDMMFNIVRFGNIHFDDLTTVLSKVAPAAKAAGYNLTDVAGAVSQVTRTMPPGMVASGFSQLMRVFADRNFQEGVRVASKLRLGRVIDIAPAGRLEKPLKILQDLVTIFPELQRGGKDTAQFLKDVTSAGQFALTGRKTVGREFTIQIRRVFEGLVQHLGSVEELQAAILANNGELGKSFRTMMQDPGVQWKLFINQLQAFVLIVGQAALPALLQLANGIQRVVEWFRNLSPHTQKLIVQIGVFGGALLLAVGIISSFIGGLVQIASNFGILSEGAGLLMNLARAGAVLAGIGAIALILKVAVTGDMSAWTFIEGAMLGAAAGSIFGPAGAILGAVTVPVVMTVLSERPRTAQEKAFAAYQKSMKGVPGFIEKYGKINIPGTGIGLPLPFKPQFDKKNFDRQWGLLYKESVAKSKGMIFPGAAGVDPSIRALFKQYHGGVKKATKDTKTWGDILKKGMGDAKVRAATQAWDDYLKKIGMVGGASNKAANAAKAHAEAVKQATQNMNQSVKQAASNLANTYDELRQQNETALGTIFQGPTMTGILGNVFSGINDTLRQFGVQIPVPFNILKQDMDQSFTYFKRWRKDIARLFKQGVPIEMVQQIEALGPNVGMAIAEGFSSGPKSGRRALIAEFKKGQNELDKATATDMKKKLQLWNSYGKDAAWATINGIINNPRNYKITKMYETYIKDTYGAVLKKTFETDVQTYMNNWAAQAKAAAQGLPKSFAIPPGAAPTGGNRTTLATMTPQQLTAAYRKVHRIVRSYSHFVGPLTPAEQRQFDKARRRQRAIVAEYARDAKATVAREMKTQAGTHTYHITYQGDTMNIKADGATPASVARALANYHFHKKHKNTKGTTVYQGGKH